MDDAFLAWLKSAWPVLVPTLTIVVAYLGLNKQARANRSQISANKIAADLRDERLRNDIKDKIGIMINGKLERIEKKVDVLTGRTTGLEVTVAALNASVTRIRR